MSSISVEKMIFVNYLLVRVLLLLLLVGNKWTEWRCWLNLVSDQCTQVSRVAEQEQSQFEYFMAVRAELS